MRVWRLTKAKYAATAFDGEGARLHGGRWNRPGRAVAYASDSAALATLEQLVRVQDVRLLKGFVLIPAEVPDDAVDALDVTRLDASWRRHPPLESTMDAGDDWLTAGSTLALRVPSVVVPGENVLINPAHPRFAEVRIGEPVVDAFDERLTG